MKANMKNINKKGKTTRNKKILFLDKVCLPKITWKNHSINIIFINETHMKKLPSATVITFVFFFPKVLSNIHHCVVNFTKVNLDEKSFFFKVHFTHFTVIENGKK